MPKTNYKPSKELSRDFIAVLQQTPGMRSPDFAKALGVHETTFSRASSALVKRGRIIRKRAGRFYAYYLPETKPDLAVKAQQQPVPADIVELAELESLRAEVADLRAFRERALDLYPDLDVDPIVLEARRITYRVLFDVGNRDGADNVLCGRADDTAIVMATVEALRRGKAAA
jgi:hypothetical protein